MNRIQMTRWTMVAAMVVCAVVGMGARSAQASTRVELGIGVGGGYTPYYAAPVYTAPVYTAPVCEGHYETRVDRVLVAGERHERRWIEPAYETRYFNGVQQNVCVRQGGWQDYCVPAQYENRSVRVWVPGCTTYSAPTVSYSNYYSPYYAPRYYNQPSFGLDLSFRGRR